MLDGLDNASSEMEEAKVIFSLHQLLHRGFASYIAIQIFY